MDKDRLIYDVNFEEGGEYWGTPVAAHPLDGDCAISSGAGNHIEKTTDGGDEWAFSGSGYCGGRVGGHGFSFDPFDEDRFAFFLIDFGAVLTQDGGSTFSNLQLAGSAGKTIQCGAIDPAQGSQTIIAAVGDWDTRTIAVSDDNGSTWDFRTGTEDDHEVILFHPQDTSVVYAGGFRSLDKGQTWQAVSHDISALSGGNGDIVYAIDGVRIAKSVDRGNTWSFPYDDLPGNVTNIAVDPADQDRVYALVEWFGLYIWSASGSTWMHKTELDGLEPDRFGTQDARSIAIDPNLPNVVYVGKWIAYRGHANGVFRSVDSGETWTNITGNLGPEFNVESLAVNPHDSYVYLGSSHGTWRLPPP
jgi:photosystem II stability/assembly factor-like uncharacterized protein